MKRISLLILLLLLYSNMVLSNAFNLLNHYSEHEGLTEINILCMLQDRKGQMWFGTYDGLNLFNGYRFRVYKNNPDQSNGLEDFRIDNIVEDNIGYLWVKTYGGRVYRFNPQNENFTEVPQSISQYNSYNPKLNNIIKLKDGSIWLYGESDGCFRVMDGNELGVEHYNRNAGTLSSNNIKKIYQDKEQNVWVLTDNGLNQFVKGSNKAHQFFKEEVTNPFYSITETGNKIIAGGVNGKVYLYQTKNKTFELINLDTKSSIIDIKGLSDSEVFFLTDNDGFIIYNLNDRKLTARTKLNAKSYACYKDRLNNVWIETGMPGTYLYNTSSKELKYFPTKANTSTESFFVFEDTHKQIWVHPRNGGFSLYNPKTQTLELINKVLNVSNMSLSSIMHVAFSDKQGNLWMSSLTRGLDKAVFIKSPFNFHTITKENELHNSNEIRSIFQDSEKRIWVGSRGSTISVFDQKHNFQGNFNVDGTIGRGKAFTINAYCFFEDTQKNIWIGTKGNGLYKLEPSSNRRFKVTNYKHSPDDIYSISSNNIYSIFEDQSRRIWIGTYGGGVNLLEQDGSGVKFISSNNRFRNYPIDNCSRIRFITGDRNGIVYIGTTSGMVVFKNNFRLPENIDFKLIRHDPKDGTSLSGNDIHSILPAKNGKLYIATFGGGLSVLEKPLNFDSKPHFKSYYINKGSPSNVFYTLNEDQTGNIWFSTQTLIGKFNTRSEYFETYTPYNELKYNFSEASSCVTDAGEMLYGTSNGYLSFALNVSLKSNYIPRIVFDDLQLFNKSVVVGIKDSPLQKIIDDTEVLELAHDQNNFTISFSALDYTNSANIKYAYKLEGFDEDWNYVYNQRFASYVNLPKGEYTFKVKSTNADGVWVSNERKVVIIRKPSFWESNWAYLLYISIFGSVFFLTMYVLNKIYQLKANVQVEQKMTNLKLQFFTDISHELRTPLTLIATPVENVLAKEKLSDSGINQLKVVQTNVDRMLRLINQILDFRKIQSKKMKLYIEQINTALIINEICQSFKSMSESRNIDFKFIDETKGTLIWVDRDKFEKIFFNLFSNAFKFSEKDSQIIVTVKESNEVVTISVRDFGVGISVDRLKLLFNRFESFVNANKVMQDGTGIGLSLTKELIELHHGSIKVFSESGEGSEFIVTFLKGKDHFVKDEDVHEDMHVNKELNTNNEDQPVRTLYIDDTISQNDKQVVLIVEDNAELRDFLRTVLAGNYHILEAENGKSALGIIQEEMPDLIITDVMMPQMTGLELAKAVKEDMRSSHIPIILLTARTDIEVKLEALNYGVDDYITKPFSSAYLEARVENILKLRKQLQELYLSTLTTGIPYGNTIKKDSQDEKFLNRIISYIDEHIEDSELTIEEIAAHLALGRSTFFKKLKSMIGISPVEFLKDYRIQKAAQLIESGEHNFAQISFMVGINDPSYFSKCFKTKFGMTPREYKDKYQ